LKAAPPQYGPSQENLQSGSPRRPAAGFRAKTFASAEELLSRDGRKACRGLILDVRMPGTSGLESLDMPVVSRDATPVVFITAHEDLVVNEKDA
jgi:FixJ family two-component response regulator